MFGREWPEPEPVSLGLEGAPRQRRGCAKSEAMDRTELYGSVLVTCVHCRCLGCCNVSPGHTHWYTVLWGCAGMGVHLHHLFEGNLMCCKSDRGPGGYTSLSSTPLLSDFHIGTSSLPPPPPPPPWPLSSSSGSLSLCGEDKPTHPKSGAISTGPVTPQPRPSCSESWRCAVARSCGPYCVIVQLQAMSGCIKFIKMNETSTFSFSVYCNRVLLAVTLGW